MFQQGHLLTLIVVVTHRFGCKSGSGNRELKKKLQMKRHTCPFDLTFKLSPDGQYLYVSNFDNRHNHELPATTDGVNTAQRLWYKGVNVDYRDHFDHANSKIHITATNVSSPPAAADVDSSSPCVRPRQPAVPDVVRRGRATKDEQRRREKLAGMPANFATVFNKKDKQPRFATVFIEKQKPPPQDPATGDEATHRTNSLRQVLLERPRNSVPRDVHLRCQRLSDKFEKALEIASLLACVASEGTSEETFQYRLHEMRKLLQRWKPSCFPPEEEKQSEPPSSPSKQQGKATADVSPASEDDPSPEGKDPTSPPPPPSLNTDEQTYTPAAATASKVSDQKKRSSTAKRKRKPRPKSAKRKPEYARDITTTNPESEEISSDKNSEKVESVPPDAAANNSSGKTSKRKRKQSSPVAKKRVEAPAPEDKEEDDVPVEEVHQVTEEREDKGNATVTDESTHDRPLSSSSDHSYARAPEPDTDDGPIDSVVSVMVAVDRVQKQYIDEEEEDGEEDVEEKAVEEEAPFHLEEIPSPGKPVLLLPPPKPAPSAKPAALKKTVFMNGSGSSEHLPIKIIKVNTGELSESGAAGDVKAMKLINIKLPTNMSLKRFKSVPSPADDSEVKKRKISTP